MMKKNSTTKMLSAFLIYLLVDISRGSEMPSAQSDTAGIGSYKTQKILASVEYDLKYKKPSKGDPVDMAYEFFQLNKSLFPISNPLEELAPRYKAFDDIGGVISFQQVYKGVPIRYSGIKMRFTGDGELKRVEGEYHSDINLPTTPSVDSASAERIALKDAGESQQSKAFRSKEYFTHLAISAFDDGKLHLVWLVWIHQDEPLHFWEYSVDALDGTILDKLDQIRR